MSIIVKQRRRARFYAIQAVYQNQFLYLSPDSLYHQFYYHNVNRIPVDWAFFKLLIYGIHNKKDIILRNIENTILSPLSQINLVNLAIIKLGVYELIFCPEIPKQIVISEYVAQAYKLGTDKGYMFVNGILEELAKAVRS